MLNHPFKPLISARRREAIATRKTVARVTRILTGEPEPRPSAYTGSTAAALAQHRIKEIDRNYDPAWPDQRDVGRLGAHHAREAATRIAGCASGWGWNFKFAGIKNQPAFVRSQLDGLIDRVEPALHAAEKEYDPSGWLRQRYQEIETSTRTKLAEIEARYADLRRVASKALRSKLRAQEAQELQVLLNELALALKHWASEFPPHG